MIQQQIMEKILQKFPGKTEPEIRIELNEIQKDFSQETEIIETEFTTFNLDGSSVMYDMDDEVIRVKQVDVDGAKIDILGGVYEIELTT